ncbi:MAG: phospho-sugar mutase, partial [Oscillospiraceae bacterium]|nr:phospho-sugar mutase [Oscillospiraceae bacterium]
HRGLEQISGRRILRTEDYSKGLKGLPASDVLKFFSEKGSVVIRPSGTEPKLKMYISVTAPDRETAEKAEAEITAELERKL